MLQVSDEVSILGSKVGVDPLDVCEFQSEIRHLYLLIFEQFFHFYKLIICIRFIIIELLQHTKPTFPTIAFSLKGIDLYDKGFYLLLQVVALGIAI